MTSPRGAPSPEVSAPPLFGAARTIAGAVLVATVVGAGLSLTIALLAVRLAQAGYSAHAIGLNTAAGGVATLLGAPLIPVAARRIGVARLLLMALVLGGIALLGFTLSSSYTAWLLLRFVIGLSVTVLFVLSEFWITSWAPAGRGGLAIGCYVTSLAGGFAAGPLLLDLVGPSGNLPFFLGAALFVLPVLPMMLNAGTAPRLDTRSRKTIFAFLREAPAPTLAAMLHGSIEVAGLSLLPVYALRSGLGARNGAILASVFIVGNSALQLPLGALSDLFDRRVLLVAIAVAGLAGAIGLGLLGVHRLVVFEALLLLWGGIVGALYPVGLGQLGALYRGADLAGANAAYVMSYALGMLVGPPLVGAGLDAAPPSGFFWAVALLIGLYLAAATPPLLRRFS